MSKELKERNYFPLASGDVTGTEIMQVCNIASHTQLNRMATKFGLRCNPVAMHNSRKLYRVKAANKFVAQYKAYKKGKADSNTSLQILEKNLKFLNDRYAKIRTEQLQSIPDLRLEIATANWKISDLKDYLHKRLALYNDELSRIRDLLASVGIAEQRTLPEPWEPSTGISDDSSTNTPK